LGRFKVEEEGIEERLEIRLQICGSKVIPRLRTEESERR